MQRDGTNEPNFTSELLLNEQLDEDMEFTIKWSAASLYSGELHTPVLYPHTFTGKKKS